MAAAWMTLVTEIVVVGTGRLLRRARARRLARRCPLGRLPRVLVAAATLTAALVAVKAAGGGLAVLSVAAAVLYPSLLLGCGAVSIAEIKPLLRKRAAGRAPDVTLDDARVA